MERVQRIKVTPELRDKAWREFYRRNHRVLTLTEEEKIAALNAHPAIGARTGLSARSAAEQGDDADPAVLSELAYQNQVYEEKFGFRFVVFVDRRAKAEILDVLRDRLARTREEELDTAVRELVAIARDRWTRST